MRQRAPRGWPLSAGLAVCMTLTLVVAPLATAETAAPAVPGVGPLAASVATHAAAVVAKGTRTPIRAQAGPQPTEPGRKPFFKSTRGTVALVAMASAIGYTLYSLNKDRITSQGR